MGLYVHSLARRFVTLLLTDLTLRKRVVKEALSRYVGCSQCDPVTRQPLHVRVVCSLSRHVFGDLLRHVCGVNNSLTIRLRWLWLD
jgi:hypothetical protein